VKRPKKPKESAEVVALRSREIRRLGELDEEENRRIKAALHPQTRAFRRSSGDSGGSVRSAAGSTGRDSLDRAGRKIRRLPD